MTTIDDLRRRTCESRVRLAAVEQIRAEHALLTVSSRRRLSGSRRCWSGEQRPSAADAAR